MCGAPVQETGLDQTLPAGVDPAKATIIQGRVVRTGEPVPASASSTPRATSPPRS